jgi:hypothetical protein
MSTLEQDLDDLEPTPPIHALATELDKRTDIESDRQAQYVSLRPSFEGAVAVYLHKTWVSIAHAPDLAAEVAAQLPEASLDHKTPATTYLHVPDHVVAAKPDVVLGIAAEAVAWRAAGPKSSVGIGHTKKPETTSQTCPEHWYELSPSGACPVCG